MKKSQTAYAILLSQTTAEQLDKYANYLNGGGDCGARLAKSLIRAKPRPLDRSGLLSALLNTKKPQIFAESHVEGDGTDWTSRELSLLGDISIAMQVSIFDNGAHQNPKVYDASFMGHLIYTPGALLRNDRGHMPADWEAVTIDNEYNREKYFTLYERRLLPIFTYISERAIERKAPAFVTIPGIGCGQFAGPFRGQMGHLFLAALVHLMETHGQNFRGIKAVYYDPYNEGINETRIIHDIPFIVRPLMENNQEKSQLCAPSFLGQDTAGNFDDCELYSLVAWDHVSWPGNDYYLGARITDDGVKAAATDTMKVMTGVEGYYSEDIYKYLPPHPYRNWEDVVAKNNLKIQTENNVHIL